MSKVSKSIFVLDDNSSYVLYEYIQMNTPINIKTSCMDWCCCMDEFNSSVTFTYKDIIYKDRMTKWIYDLSFSYLAQSGIDFTKLRLYMIECMVTNNPVFLKNSKTSTVIFHINDPKNAYVTTHDSKLNYLADDKRYIVVTFDTKT